MCDFFFYTAPEEQNTVRIFNVAFSRDERGSSCPDDETSDAVMLDYEKNTEICEIKL